MMQRPNKRNARFNRRDAQNRQFNSTNLTSTFRRQLNGVANRISPDPPTFVACPWNTLTVGLIFNSTGSGTTRALIQVGALAADIKAQLGILSAVESLQFRLRQIRAWEDTTAAPPTNQFSYFNMDVYDVNSTITADTNTRILQSVNDTCAKNHFARVSYIYPNSVQQMVLDELTPNQIIAGFDYPQNATVFVYINLLWRFIPPREDVTFSTEHSLITARLQNKPSCVASECGEPVGGSLSWTTPVSPTSLATLDSPTLVSEQRHPATAAGRPPRNRQMRRGPQGGSEAQASRNRAEKLLPLPSPSGESLVSC